MNIFDDILMFCVKLRMVVGEWKDTIITKNLLGQCNRQIVLPKYSC